MRQLLTPTNTSRGTEAKDIGLYQRFVSNRKLPHRTSDTSQPHNNSYKQYFFPLRPAVLHQRKQKRLFAITQFHYSQQPHLLFAGAGHFNSTFFISLISAFLSFSKSPMIVNTFSENPAKQKTFCSGNCIEP